MVDVSLVPEAAWHESRRRAEVIRPLVESTHRSRRLVQAAAATLGLSERHTYTILRRCREAGGDLLCSLAPRVAAGTSGAWHRPARQHWSGSSANSTSHRGSRPRPGSCARSSAGVARRNCPFHLPTPFDGASRRCPSLTCDPRRGASGSEAGAWPCTARPASVGPGSGGSHAHGPDRGRSDRSRTDWPPLAHGRDRHVQPLHRGFPCHSGGARCNIRWPLPDARRDGPGAVAGVGRGAGDLASAGQTALMPSLALVR